MGAKPGKRSSSSLRVRVCGKDGLVAQLLHPDWIARDDAKAVGSNLRAVEDELTRVNAQAKLVLSGGGLLEVYWDATLSHKSWRSEATLNTLVDQVHASVQPILNALASAKRDYVIGVDVFDKNDIGGGQFAVVLNKGTIKAIAWKSYPVLQESNWLAGFGTLKGRQSPRVLSTALGTTAVLVCHDVQAYNHRNQALVRRAYQPTDRNKVITDMESLMRSSKSEWVLSLVHQIDEESDMVTFRKSYKQLNADYDHAPTVIGAFGYGPSVQSLLLPLAEKAQFPDGSSNTVVVLEP
jgi:hypothetical protein